MQADAESLGLELKKLFFPKISVEANPSYKPVKGSSLDTFSVGGNIIVEPDDSRMHVSLKFFTDNDAEGNENVKYRVEVQIYSCYALKKDFTAFSEEEKKSALTILGTILLGSLREMICMTTARAPWGTYLLPSMNISNLVENLAENISIITPSAKKKKVPGGKSKQTKASET